jgi:hypothetical protein
MAIRSVSEPYSRHLAARTRGFLLCRHAYVPLSRTRVSSLWYFGVEWDESVARDDLGDLCK